MTKTVEIKGITIAKVAIVLLGMSLLIYLLNGYDRKEKSALLQKNIELLENSPVVDRIKTHLIGYDSLPHDKVKDIMAELSVLNQETNGIHYYRPTVIIESDNKYLTISSKNHGYYSKEVRTPIDSKTEAIVEELQKEDADVFQVLDQANKMSRQKRIVLPLTKSNQKQAYLFFKYAERH